MYLKTVSAPLLNVILVKDEPIREESTRDNILSISGSRPLRALLGVAPLIGSAPVLIKTPMSG